MERSGTLELRTPRNRSHTDVAFVLVLRCDDLAYRRLEPGSFSTGRDRDERPALAFHQDPALALDGN